MEFEEKEDHTVLKLKQTLVPSNEYDSTNGNWQRYYFESIRQTFGFGSFLYWANTLHSPFIFSPNLIATHVKQKKWNKIIS